MDSWGFYLEFVLRCCVELSSASLDEYTDAFLLVDALELTLSGQRIHMCGQFQWMPTWFPQWAHWITLPPTDYETSIVSVVLLMLFYPSPFSIWIFVMGMAICFFNFSTEKDWRVLISVAENQKAHRRVLWLIKISNHRIFLCTLFHNSLRLWLILGSLPFC